MTKSAEAIENNVIDETFKGLSNPSKIYRLGGESLEGERPGEALVSAVIEHTAKGGFTQSANHAASDDVVVSIKSRGHVGIEVANPVEETLDVDKKKDIKD